MAKSAVVTSLCHFDNSGPVVVSFDNVASSARSGVLELVTLIPHDHVERSRAAGATSLIGKLTLIGIVEFNLPGRFVQTLQLPHISANFNSIRESCVWRLSEPPVNGGSPLRYPVTNHRDSWTSCSRSALMLRSTPTEWTCSHDFSTRRLRLHEWYLEMS